MNTRATATIAHPMPSAHTGISTPERDTAVYDTPLKMTRNYRERSMNITWHLPGMVLNLRLYAY